MKPNKIDNVFTDDRLKLMTHVVAGYPDMETTERLVIMMAQCGVHLVEIQIPFSDPLADGPTIATANQVALENGVTPDHCFQLAERLHHRVNIPLLFMTYANIPYHMGIETFIRRSCESGISGLIIPDLPFDQFPEYPGLANANQCYPIPVISPGTGPERLDNILIHAGGFIYTTLRVGITGARHQIEPQGLAFLDTLRRECSLPIAAGFGISSPQMVDQLKGKAHAAVIGSHIINLLNNHGIDAVANFLLSLSKHS